MKFIIELVCHKSDFANYFSVYKLWLKWGLEEIKLDLVIKASKQLSVMGYFFFLLSDLFSVECTVIYQSSSHYKSHYNLRSYFGRQQVSTWPITDLLIEIC